MVFTQVKQGLKQENNSKDIKQSHSRVFLSGIFDARRYENRKPYLVNDGMRRDPGQKPSGMTLCDERQLQVRGRSRVPTLGDDGLYVYERQTACGFTLIELLVVVLIIGILAAVALPQYQKAVEKSKSAQAMALLNPLIQSIEAYHLANGTYPTKFEQLDVEVPNWTGTEKPYPTLSDYRTGEEWSVWLFNEVSFGVGVTMTRMSGPYKGGAFGYNFYRVNDDDVPVGKISCIEYGNFNLAAGAYCEKIFKGVLYRGVGVRFYLLP